MIVKKIKNTIRYRLNVIKKWWIKNVKYHNIKNKVMKEEVIRYDVYLKMKKKYAKIVKKNSNKSPVNDSNKIWIFWFQGRENAPQLINRCINEVEKKLKDFEVIVLTKNNYKEYVNLPEYIMQKFDKGIISLTHLSDIIRTNVLINHGGLWLDATVLCNCTKIPNYMKKCSLFVYKDIKLNKNDTMPIAASSWLIWAGRNNNILMATQDMLNAYWKKANVLEDYFLFHILFKIATEIYCEEWEEVPTYNNINPHMIQLELFDKFNNKRWQQIMAMADFYKLSRHQYLKTDYLTNYDYILNEFKEKK